MNGYIPKQPKQIKERIEAKLDVRLIRKLESYCEYLESDRDYIISQALEIAFKKDKQFTDWLARRPAGPAVDAGLNTPSLASRRGRKPARLLGQDQTGNDADAAESSNTAAPAAVIGA